MPYESSIDIVQILRSTLYLLEHSLYAQKPSSTVEDLKLHISQAIADLEAAKRPVGKESLISEDGLEDKAELA